MNITTGSTPVRHFICDNFVTPSRDWAISPTTEWEVSYSNTLESGKRTTRKLSGWSADVMHAMCSPELLRHCSQLFGATLTPDTLLWGGGLQTLAPGGWLATHLDGVRHPKRPSMRRAVQLVCFCHYEWRREWGGDFYFTDGLGEIVTEIEALPGRLIAFESDSEAALHGVSRVSGPNERVSVSMSLLAESRPSDVRMRALFMPVR